MWSRAFWLASTERALKSAANAMIVLLVGDKALNLWNSDNLKTIVEAAILAAVVSYLMSVLSLPAGGNGPSLTTKEQLTP